MPVHRMHGVEDLQEACVLYAAFTVYVYVLSACVNYRKCVTRSLFCLFLDPVHVQQAKD